MREMLGKGGRNDKVEEMGMRLLGVWTLIPMEVWDQRPGLRRARGSFDLSSRNIQIRRPHAMTDRDAHGSLRQDQGGAPQDPRHHG
jgi:hypothetical protein